MKTTEELRKELDYWMGRRDEFKGGLNLTNEIRIAENLLKASEKGDLLFGDKQVQSKLAYVNDLLATSGIPLMVARKSDFLDYTHPREAEESYKGLALMYHRKDNKGFQLLDSFDTVETVGEILDQLTIVEQQKDLLYFLCSLTKTKGRPPYYRGQLGKGELNFHYFGEESSLVDGSTLFIIYNSETDQYTIGFERAVKGRCKGGVDLPTLSGIDTKATVYLPDVERLKIVVSKENVRSTDLKGTLEELKARLLGYLEQKEHEVTVTVRLVTD